MLKKNDDTFQIKFLKIINELEKEKNTLISPYSLLLVMKILYLGSSKQKKNYIQFYLQEYLKKFLIQLNHIWKY